MDHGVRHSTSLMRHWGLIVVAVAGVYTDVLWPRMCDTRVCEVPCVCHERS